MPLNNSWEGGGRCGAEHSALDFIIAIAANGNFAEVRPSGTSHLQPATIGYTGRVLFAQQRRKNLTRKSYFSAFTLGAWFIAVSTPALAQNRLLIDDTGKVVPEHQQHHAKKGDKISWARQSGAKKSWYIKFPGDSPCAEGKEFRSARHATCTVSAACGKPGDPACKSYHYQSATARQATLNDPEIVLDP
jgi:hypothetical protein